MYETIPSILFAIAAGVLPAVIWLFFWLREENPRHPVSRKRIIATFTLGMLTVPFALATQIVFNLIILPGITIDRLIALDIWLGIVALFVWASVEEILKVIAAHSGGFRQRVASEAIDAPIYTITAALGFAALENVLFLITPLLEGDTVTALITGNMRFIGATLLHVATSGVIGICIAFSYFRAKRVKKRYFLIGLILATGLHTLFNLFIILNDNTPFLAFLGVWFIIIGIIIIFEKLKSIHLNKI